MALTRTESVQETLTVFADATSVYALVVKAFEEVGKPKTKDEHFRRVVGRIGSGAGNLNSATVSISVEIVEAEQSRLRIEASAQEGLVKQHTAPKAISRLLAELARSELPTSPPGKSQWASDPFGRFDHRYFDGRTWTDKVATRGETLVDPPSFPLPSARLVDGSGWTADPYGRFELRYVDSNEWTSHVARNGQTSSDPVGFPAPRQNDGVPPPPRPPVSSID